MTVHIKTFDEFTKEDKKSEDTLRIEDFFDVSSISEKDIRSINSDMRIFLQGRGFGDSILCKGKKLIAESETVTVTIPVAELRKRLRTMGFKSWQVVSEVIANKVRVVILYADVAKNTQTIILEMKSMGWDKAKISEPMLIYGVKCRAMCFDPAFQEDLTEEVHRHKYLYHITPIVNVDSILSHGIEIRSENEHLDYPPRAHVIKGDTRKCDVAYFGWQLFSVNNKCKDGKYAILRLDVSKIPLSISFYGDPRYEHGYITKENIPSNGIELFGNITYTDKSAYHREHITVTAPDDTMPN